MHMPPDTALPVSFASALAPSRLRGRTGPAKCDREGAKAPRQTRRRYHANARGGFTLVELLISIAIIVLLLGIALPVFRVISGSRSQEGASNQIAAALARARNDAVGLQVPTGICFFTDAAGRSNMAEVQQVQFSTWSGTAAYPPGSYVSYTTNYYVCTSAVAASATSNNSPDKDTTDWSLVTATATSTSPGFTDLFDQIANTDLDRLPVGVGTMVLSDAGQTGATPNSQDRYLHVGMMVFDANGRLITQPFWMSQFGLVGTAAGFKAKGENVSQNAGTAIAGASDLGLSSGPPAPALKVPCTLFSGIGVVTVDAEAFNGQGPNADYVIDTAVPAVSSYGTASTAGTKAAEDAWLDANATPLLINRYNGTLLRSE